MSFAERLKSLREERGLSQGDLGKLVGVCRSTIGGYEAPSKEREPEFEVVSNLANYFSVSVDYLFGRTDRRTPASVDMAKVSAAAEQIALGLTEDPELAEFWGHLRKRKTLRLIIREVCDLDDVSIQRIIRVVRALEAEKSQ